MVEEATEQQGRTSRIDVVITVILALAAVATAWAGFQASSWNGQQSAATARAAALRTEAEIADSTADSLRTVDLLTFLDWVSAIAEESAAGSGSVPTSSYAPLPGTRSAFLYARFRAEFQPAFDAWIATGPLVNPDAPGTPFEMAEYQLASAAHADDLLEQSRAAGAEATAANDRSGDYVLMGVLLALVLFFASVSSRATGRRRTVLQWCAISGFVLALAFLISRPIIW